MSVYWDLATLKASNDIFSLISETSGSVTSFSVPASFSVVSTIYSSVSGFISSRPRPMRWAPRWMDAYYSDSSVTQKWFYHTLYVPGRQFLDYANRNIVPKFFGDTGQSRLIYRVQYSLATRTLPDISLNITDSHAVTGQVKIARTFKEFLFEEIEPIALFRADEILLRNIAAVRFYDEYSAGVLYISHFLATHPAVEDTQFVLTDPWDEQVIVDQNSQAFLEDRILTTLSGPYDVAYLSQAVHDAFVLGHNTISVGDEVRTVSQDSVENVWDEYIGLMGYHRRPTEGNETIKFKAQQLSFARSPAMRIAAMMGRARWAFWDTLASSLSLAGSAATTVEVTEIPEWVPIREVPVRDEGKLALTAEPRSNFVQIFVQNQNINPRTYSINGSAITPSGGLLSSIDPSQIRIHYPVQIWSKTTSGNFVTGLTTHHLIRDPYWVLVGSDVLVSDSIKKIKEWKWDREYGVLSGLAEFE